VTPFAVDVKRLPANFQMARMELQSDTQLKNVIISLPDFYKTSFTREIYLSLHNHTLSTPLLFDSASVNNYCQG